MKRILLLILTMTALGAYAQGEKGRWTITPRVGTNMSTMDGLKWYATDGDGTVGVASGVDVKQKWGVTLGADAEWHFAKRLSLSGGWYFSDQGYAVEAHGADAVITASGTRVDGTLNGHLYCFNMPVMVSAYVLPHVAVKAGLQVDGLVSARRTYSGGRDNILNEVKTVGLVVPVGLSYDYHRLTTDVRYCFGLTDWCDIHQYNRLGASWTTRSLWLTLGYHFDL